MQLNSSASALEFANSHYKTPALVEHGIRCGKPNCKCATSAYRHGPYAYLYWRDGDGRAHRVYVPKAEIAQVRQVVQLRQAIDRQQRQMLAESRAYLRELRQIGKSYAQW
jgi:hypothetical protein